MNQLVKIALRRPYTFVVLSNYPFTDRLFSQALDGVEHVKGWGKTAIVLDGLVVFQSRKIECSGLFDALERNVLRYIHK